MTKKEQVKPLLVNIRQVCTILGVGRATVSSLIKRGLLGVSPHLKTKRLVPLSDVLRLVSEAETNKAATLPPAPDSAPDTTSAQDKRLLEMLQEDTRPPSPEIQILVARLAQRLKLTTDADTDKLAYLFAEKMQEGKTPDLAFNELWKELT